MKQIIAKLENFETKLKGLFNGSEVLPYDLSLGVKEVEDFKNSFTTEEIKKLSDFQIKLFYDGYTYNFVQRLLRLLVKSDCVALNKIKEPWVGKLWDFDGDGESIELYWDIELNYQNVNLTFLIQQIKENM